MCSACIIQYTRATLLTPLSPLRIESSISSFVSGGIGDVSIHTPHSLHRQTTTTNNEYAMLPQAAPNTERLHVEQKTLIQLEEKMQSSRNSNFIFQRRVNDMGDVVIGLDMPCLMIMIMMWSLFYRVMPCLIPSLQIS